MTVVHILLGGRALCGRAGYPNEWPPDHVWVASYLAARDATCPGCRERWGLPGIAPAAVAPDNFNSPVTIRLTTSQLMALKDLVLEHLLCPTHTEVYIDVWRNIETTPEELLQVLVGVPADEWPKRGHAR